MSLYETDGPQEAAASKIPVGTGQKPGHAAAPQQQATAGKEQDDAAASIIFQLGGKDSYNVTLSNISLVKIS